MVIAIRATIGIDAWQPHKSNEIKKSKRQVIIFATNHIVYPNHVCEEV